MDQKSWKRWLFYFSLGIAIIVAFKTIDSVAFIYNGINNLIALITPFLVAAFIAFLLFIPQRKLEKLFEKGKFKFIKKHSRGLSVLAVYIVALAIICLVINLVIPRIGESVIELAKNVPGYIDRGIEYFEGIGENNPLYKLNLADSLKNIKNFDFLNSIQDYLSINNVFMYLGKIVGTTGIILDIFISIVVSVYLLMDRTSIKQFLKKFCKAMFNEKVYGKISKYYHKFFDIFIGFLFAQIVDAVIVGIGSIIILSIMGVKYAFLLGLFIGLFNLIPYFGAIFAVVLSIIITIFSGGIIKALEAGLLIIVFQQIDSNVINPKIIGDSLNISPILVIASVTIGGHYFGVPGMFFGVPIASFLKVLIVDYIDKKIENKKIST